MWKKLCWKGDEGAAKIRKCGNCTLDVYECDVFASRPGGVYCVSKEFLISSCVLCHHFLSINVHIMGLVSVGALLLFFFVVVVCFVCLFTKL